VGLVLGAGVVATGTGISEDTGETELDIGTEGEAETEDIWKEVWKERLEVVLKVAGPHNCIKFRKDSIFSKIPTQTGFG
jgi:hypothetical protein